MRAIFEIWPTEQPRQGGNLTLDNPIFVKGEVFAFLCEYPRLSSFVLFVSNGPGFPG